MICVKGLFIGYFQNMKRLFSLNSAKIDIFLSFFHFCSLYT